MNSIMIDGLSAFYGAMSIAVIFFLIGVRAGRRIERLGLKP